MKRNFMLFGYVLIHFLTISLLAGDDKEKVLGLRDLATLSDFIVRGKVVRIETYENQPGRRYSNIYCPTQSTITYLPALASDPNPGRSIVPIDDNNKIEQTGISYSVLSDYFSQAEQKYNEGKYNEAIDLYLEAFKQEKDNSIRRLALIKMEECFTKVGRKDYLFFSNQKKKAVDERWHGTVCGCFRT